MADFLAIFVPRDFCLWHGLHDNRQHGNAAGPELFVFEPLDKTGGGLGHLRSPGSTSLFGFRYGCHWGNTHHGNIFVIAFEAWGLQRLFHLFHFSLFCFDQGNVTFYVTVVLNVESFHHINRGGQVLDEEWGWRTEKNS